MSHRLHTIALQPLRRQRRPLAWIMAALVAVSLNAAFLQCLSMSAMSFHGAGSVEATSLPGEMPCADCSAGGDASLLDQAAITLLGSAKPAFVFALIVVATLLTFGRLRSFPVPPRPALPSRPRTLKFAVLRI